MAEAPATSERPRILYTDKGPEAPYPLQMEGEVISGFGRGSKELGIPTANLPVEEAQISWIANITSGVYFGYAALKLPANHPDIPSASSNSSSTTSQKYHIFPMVMSIGYNPFYKNSKRSAEVHILHKFAQDFYGAPMRLLLLGFVREEKNYAGVEALIEDINFDCEVARRSLDREAWTPREGVVGAGTGTLDGSWLVLEDAA
ncbi:riboflavin kinase [Apiospora phragmitis]|uniref:Riboflavin kinase n=1 Tax=Apiospora phragmitis TaxID=2905665 RepID=A0ABR1VDZ2_9PEZI